MCSIGEHLGVVCSFGSEDPLQYKDDFSKEEWKLLKLRSGRSQMRCVCSVHKLNFLTVYESRQTVCCNPLPGRHLKGVVKGTRVITMAMYRKAKGTVPLVPGKKLCPSCKDVVCTIIGDLEELESSQSFETPESSQQEQQKEEQPKETEEPTSPTQAQDLPYLRPRQPAPVITQRFSTSSAPTEEGSTGSSGYAPPSEQLDILNECVKKLGCSEVDKYKLKSYPSYGSTKLQDIVNVSRSILQKNAGSNTVQISSSVEEQGFLEVLQSLKTKFVSATTTEEKVLVLSVLPQSWSVAKVKEEFGPCGASDYIIRKTKEIVTKHGILHPPDPKPGRSLSQDTVDKIKAFYELDEISSKQMPGCRDYISIRENGIKIQKQKRMLLSNLETLYEEYNEQCGKTHPVGFSKFAELRPKHCVFAGAPGTHTVCVCIHHEGMNLLFEGSKLKQASAGEENPITKVTDCIKYLVCEKPKPACYLRECDACPSSDAFRERIRRLLEDDNLVENVTYRAWLKIDKRYHLEKITKPVGEFIDLFIQSLEKLVPHHFITTEQSSFYQKKKEELKVGEALVVSDFAENYSCVMPNEVQGYHWSHEQVTLHPFVAYYRNHDGKLNHLSYVAISDHKKHVTASFYAFQRKFVPFLKAKLSEENIVLGKIFYFSDGCSAQYKSRKSTKNLCHHEEDFGVQVEWHYFASYHGKGPCDGVGGTVKRKAMKASLQGTIISNGQEMFNYATANVSKTKFDYFGEADVEQIILEQEERFKGVEVLSGISSFHCIIPLSLTTVFVKRYSASEEGQEMTLVRTRSLPDWESLRKYVVVVKEDKWCLAEIVAKNDISKELEVFFFEPAGRSRYYKMPPSAEKERINWTRVLVAAHPVLGRRSSTLPAEEKTTADKELKLFKEMTAPIALTFETDEDPDDPEPEELQES